MVGKRKLGSRSAFTMIELIFAIVIISIAVISIPVMSRITSKGIESNILQEAIFAGSAELMGATSYYWDRNSMEDANLSRYSRVIDIGTPPCEDDPNNSRFRLRPGHILQPLHRRCLENNDTAIFDAANNDFPNLNNAEHGSQEIFFNPDPTAAGYKESYKSIVDISYVDETGNPNNNVKKITVTVTKADGTAITLLSTYSANIGEIDFFRRRL